jgi:hypothetical protein
MVPFWRATAAVEIEFVFSAHLQQIQLYPVSEERLEERDRVESLR